MDWRIRASLTEARDPIGARIAIIAIGADGGGSIGVMIRTQAELLARSRPVSLVSDGLPSGEVPYETLSVKGADLTWLRRFGHAPREIVTSRRLLARLARLHAERPVAAALLHSHTLAALGARRLRRLGVRTLLVAHSDIRLRPPGTYDPLLTRLYRWSNPRAYRRVDRVLALTSPYAELARGDVADPARVELLPGPVEGPWPAVPARRVLTGAGRPLRLGFAGRLAVEKGLEALLDAVAELGARGVAVELALAGEGPRGAALRGRVESFGLSEHVRFLGWLPRGELASFYGGLDLFVIPSISENQGCASQEALLHGLPVVASRAGGLVDVVRPGIDGELCEAGDAASIAAAIERARARLLGDGYELPDPEWMERFSPAGHARRLRAAIDGVLG